MRSPLGASAARQPRNSASAVQERRPSLHFLSGTNPNRPRGVAQPGSVPEWGSGGRGFESLHPDRKQLVHTSDDPSLGTPSAPETHRSNPGSPTGNQLVDTERR